jgi:hypothetical protein
MAIAIKKKKEEKLALKCGAARNEFHMLCLRGGKTKVVCSDQQTVSAIFGWIAGIVVRNALFVCAGIA